MSQLILINGYTGCGKDTLSNLIKKEVFKDNVYLLSVSDVVKDISKKYTREELVNTIQLDNLIIDKMEEIIHKNNLNSIPTIIIGIRQLSIYNKFIENSISIWIDVEDRIRWMRVRERNLKQDKNIQSIEELNHFDKSVFDLMDIELDIKEHVWTGNEHTHNYISNNEYEYGHTTLYVKGKDNHNLLKHLKFNNNINKGFINLKYTI